MAYSVANTRKKHIVFRKALLKIMAAKDKSKKFTYIDFNSGAGIGFLLFDSYVRDKEVVNSSFEVITECIRQKRNASVYLIDNNKEVILSLKENLKSYYRAYNIECRGPEFIIKDEEFEISVTVFHEKNVDAVKKIREMIDPNDVGFIYADPIGAVHNSEKCFNCFEKFYGLDLLAHYSETNKDRFFHNTRINKKNNCRTMNDIERDSKRKYKYTMGIISRAVQNYSFFFATNEEYSVVSEQS